MPAARHLASALVPRCNDNSPVMSTADSTELASASTSFTVAEPEPQAPPIEVDLSPASPVAPDTEITVTMSFGGL